MKRRAFLEVLTKSVSAGMTVGWSRLEGSAGIMTVTGPIEHGKMGFTLIHEHIMVDFVGAGEVGPHRYDARQVIDRALPFLSQLKNEGCKTLVDCTPAFLGRDVALLKQLSEASGLYIISNTGFYGAVEGKYLPGFAFTESADQLAKHWINEWKNGIDDTDILPGLIKIGVNRGPLNTMDRKLIEAAALTHLETGLSISSHTGNGLAALEQIIILEEHKVNPRAFRWVHAQNEKDKEVHLEAARKGAWIEFDGISENSMEEHIQFLLNMKEHGLLDQCLVSQDSGWYHVGEENGGNFRPYTYIFEVFIPELKKGGFSKKEVRKLMIENPRRSLEIMIRAN
ncbi:MAG: phosphotriesterase [Saprospiraceae bacterium]|nr:phosphotriesterase [Saprospiraceae bacterium]